ncbi:MULTISPECIES: PAS domain-containing protein [unclassified Mucilaginibacter]|uniref:PAS domain-containing protein n=1 Tax=unclassified Mucilaginibacter TaxID=2617802 RepID=UPI002AC8EC90|nr:MULTISPECIES: PAS domain-containing protein [unclassified Mucilaginibacter]MEB0261620.1 PAS domain-containing protein [Mucilaginibacter sp. 10I4]MEB0278484.1 PAS domain-containing protein [Mucilaginibacter sp. 10B2]MEB0300704.1 PAS domain-containing protein [Mucilaginibacter sp. 5C4]WPX25742.1 PAS domain-containing protein [Mucilaginibacter sp. 5C4]
MNSWNSGVERVLGYTETEAVGQCADMFFTPEDVAIGAPEYELNTALKEGRAIEERYHMRKDGSRFWGSGFVFPLFDEEGNHRGYTKIMRNLSEEENARKKGSQL